MSYTDVSTAVKDEDSELKKYLFFSIDSVQYGVELSLVSEIITMRRITPIPSTKPFCKGVIKIRGSIVPVIDMRIKLNKPACEYTSTACIVVLDLGGESVGAIVERVLNVEEIPESKLLESPVNSEVIGHRNISSKIVGNSGGTKQILDVYKVFDIDE